MIDAFEKRDVATVDISGAFLQTKIPKGEDKVHIIFDGRMAEPTATVVLEIYQEYVHQRRGQPYMYCHVNVVIEGTLKTALLFWKKLFSSLKQRDFIINP